MKYEPTHANYMRWLEELQSTTGHYYVLPEDVVAYVSRRYPLPRGWAWWGDSYSGIGIERNKRYETIVYADDQTGAKDVFAACVERAKEMG
jgi:hypothetical protein